MTQKSCIKVGNPNINNKTIAYNQTPQKKRLPYNQTQTDSPPYPPPPASAPSLPPPLRPRSAERVNMSHIQYLDELVKEYLLFRGFSQTLRSLDNELKIDKDKGFRVSWRISGELGRYRDSVKEI